MADALAGVAPDVQERTKALLQAVAQGGTAGLQAYKATEASLNAAKGQSIDRARALGGLIGGPEAQGFENVAAGQYDRRLADNAIASQAFESDLARRSGAQKSYLDQVAAAVPLVRADTERQLAVYRAKAEAAAAKAARDAESSDELSDSELRTRLLGGADVFRDDTNAALESEIDANQDEPIKFSGGLLGAVNQLGLKGLNEKGREAYRGKKSLAGMTQSQIAQQLGEAQGYDPARVRGLLGPTAAAEAKAAVHPADAAIMSKARLTAKDLAAVKADPDYARLRQKIAGYVGAGLDWADVEALIASLPSQKTRSKRALLAEFKSQF